MWVWQALCGRSRHHVGGRYHVGVANIGRGRYYVGVASILGVGSIVWAWQVLLDALTSSMNS